MNCSSDEAGPKGSRTMRIVVGRDGWWVVTEDRLETRVLGPYRSLDEAIAAVERYDVVGQPEETAAKA
jgi:hypothetical protein